MIRLLARTVLSLLANAVGLLVASVILEDFDINGVSFAVAVAIFTGTTILLGPFVTKVALRNAPYLMGGIALVTTFVGLVITNLVSDGISINGVTAWVLATFIVWLFSVLANVILPLFIFKEVLEKVKENREE